MQQGDQGPLRLKVQSSTPVLISGAQKSPSDPQPGQDVKVTYRTVDGQLVADKIETVSP